MKKKARKPLKFWYIQDWGTYTNQTPVFVGYTAKEITRALRKAKVKQEAVDLWAKGEADHQKFMDRQAFMWFDQGYSLMWIGKFTDTWNDHECILHECFHAVIHCLGKQKGLIRSESDIEDEAMAYALEYLFRGIRRKLQDKYYAD